MTDREHLRLHGYVHTLETEFAEFDPDTSSWQPARKGPTWTFDREGRQDGYFADERPTVTTVDERGLRTTIGPRPPFIPRQHGMEYGVGIGAVTQHDVLTRYDAHEHPVDVLYRGEAEKILHRIMITYDDQHRIVREQILMGDTLGDRWSASVDSAGGVEAPSTDQREQFAAMIRALMPDGIFATFEYTYDGHGRVAQRVRQMARMQESRETYMYDDYGNVTEQHYEGTDRDTSIDDDGALVMAPKSSNESWTRYEYRYDDRDNWVERVSLRRLAGEATFHRLAIERRTIAYF